MYANNNNNNINYCEIAIGTHNIVVTAYCSAVYYYRALNANTFRRYCYPRRIICAPHAHAKLFRSNVLFIKIQLSHLGYNGLRVIVALARGEVQRTCAHMYTRTE